MNKLLMVAVLAHVLLGGCASAPDSGASGTSARGGSVEVFGTIDAAISHTTNRSGR